MIFNIILGIILIDIGLIGILYVINNANLLHLIWLGFILLLGIAITYSSFRPVIM
jgi:hypothetical protein